MKEYVSFCCDGELVQSGESILVFVVTSSGESKAKGSQICLAVLVPNCKTYQAILRFYLVRLATNELFRNESIFLIPSSRPDFLSWGTTVRNRNTLHAAG